MLKTGFISGNKSHARGGIDTDVIGSNKKINVESQEYYLCRDAMQSTSIHTFKNKTNKQILDDIHAQYNCKPFDAKVNGGDWILCKVAVNDNTKRSYTGTVAEIVNSIQESGSCKVEGETADVTMQKGGELIKRADGHYSKRGLWDNIRDNIGSGRKPTKEMLKKEAKIKQEEMQKGGHIPHSNIELLAPNGNKSNLTEEQWHLVRSPAFISWFGDWLKLAMAKIKDPAMDEVTLDNLSKDVSKVIDENMEPLIVSIIEFEYTCNGHDGVFISKKYGLSLNYVYRHLQKMSLTRSNREANGVTDELVNLGLELYKKGKSTRSVAKELGVHKSSVNRWINKEEITRSTSEHYGITPDTISEVLQLYRDGIGAKTISKKVNVSDTSIYRILVNNNIKIRNKGDAQSIRASQGRQPIWGIRSVVNTVFGKLRADSVYEAVRIFQLQNDPNVISIKRAERIPYNKSYYTPDLDIDYKDGLKVIEEVKPNYKLKHEDVISKKESSEKYYGNSSIYRIITELEIGIDAFKNVDLLKLEFSSSEDKMRFIRALRTAISNQIKIADGSNTTFDENNDDIRYEQGGSIDDNNKEIYQKWKSLVNMSKSELKEFYDSKEGKEAGLSSSEANKLGINNGRESARWIMKMKETPVSEWTPKMWEWAGDQISFISRMSGNKGPLYDEKGNKTRKHTSLLIWGHNPEKMNNGGELLKGIKEEKEHLKTAQKLYNHEITPQQAPKKIAMDHLREDENYYTKLDSVMEQGGKIKSTKPDNMEYSEGISEVQTPQFGLGGGVDGDLIMNTDNDYLNEDEELFKPKEMAMGGEIEQIQEPFLIDSNIQDKIDEDIMISQFGENNVN